MTSRQKMLLAALTATALIATAAGAHTIHPQSATGEQPAAERTQATSPSRATTGSANVDDAPSRMQPLQLRGILACATPTLHCSKIQWLLPE